MATVEKRYLAPLNPETTISEDDRAKVYDLIRQRLADLLTGNQSYFPDGVKKGADLRASDLDGFIASLRNMQPHVDDPSNILGSAIKTLQDHADAVHRQIDTDEPADHIEMSPALTPFTRDDRYIYVDPDSGPYSPPNPFLPQNLPRDRKASLKASVDRVGPAVANSGPVQLSPSDSLPGFYSGQPVKLRVVPPPIFRSR